MNVKPVEPNEEARVGDRGGKNTHSKRAAGAHSSKGGLYSSCTIDSQSEHRLVN